MCVYHCPNMCGVSFPCPLVHIPVLHQCHTILSTMTSFAKARPAILFSFFRTTWLFLVMGFSTSIFHVYLEPSKRQRGDRVDSDGSPLAWPALERP